MKITIPITWQELTFEEWRDSINKKLKEIRYENI